MVFVTLTSLPHFISSPFSRQHLPKDNAYPAQNGNGVTTESKNDSPIRILRPRQVPLKQWALQVIVLTSSSLLNNWAYAWKIPLEVMIVLRSGGETSYLVHAQ